MQTAGDFGQEGTGGIVVGKKYYDYFYRARRQDMGMHFRKVVLTGSGVNKKGDMLPVDVLFDTLEFTCEGIPSFINHDNAVRLSNQS